ncbi:sphingomyelin phosphodiesterase-like [Littorina saxatilis]|uniref:Sphingomyelin phosphodiesterase n=1 Tax=Littorina saxatilis TaxID=31220 RepID=A0AAN9G1A7_9CAEN
MRARFKLAPVLLASIFLNMTSAIPLLFKSEKTHSYSLHYLEKSNHDETKLQEAMKKSKLFSQTFPHEVKLAPFLQSGKFQSITCSLCKLGVAAVQKALSSGMSSEAIVELAKTICVTFAHEDDRVCTGLVNMFKDEVLTVLDSLILSPEEVCGLVFGDDCAESYWPFDAWNVTLPDVPKPPVVPHVLPKPGSPTVRVLHLTDIHLDTLYSAGSKATCGEPLCCRADDGQPDTGGPGAGYYGDYRNCDTPAWTLEGLFTHLAKQQFDYILWTGDLPAHNIWNQSRSDQTGMLRNLTAMVKKYFPDKPVFPALGNHESSPVNSFPPSEIKGNQSISWLYDALADTWAAWLPAETLDTIRTGAYYSVSPYPGLRVVSVNTNACNNMNWWLFFNETDPDGQLAWLIKTLQKAENNKEKVHIIGHIPPGIDDCLEMWSRNFYKIVDRYESTISGQFFGHTHHDHFQVFYDLQTLKRPTNVAYISPSVTPFSNLNMGYRIFTLDGNYSASSWEVLDHETYILNLTAANTRKSPPTWDLEYSAKAKYGMTSFFPEDWDVLVSRMEKNDSLLQTFHSYYYKSHASGPCDSSCSEALVCALRSAKSHSTKLFCPSLRTSAAQHLAQLSATMC